jgi:hypothetical protein
MNRLPIILAALLSLSACAPINVNFQNAKPLYNGTNAVGVGDVFFHYEEMTGQDDGSGTVVGVEATMFELTVIQLTNSTISLQYREYTKSPGPEGGYRMDGPWIVQQASNQEYKYDLAARIIKFKRFEFVVLEVAGDSIFYQRIS